MDLIDLYDRATAWAGSMIPVAADQLDGPTPCETWTVRDLLNHMVSVQDMFAGAARGGAAGPPEHEPPDVLSDDPARQYEDARREVLAAFGEEGALEKAGQTLGIAFVDQLVHGWDLAKATGQGTQMPQDLAERAFSMIDGRIPDERRGPLFKPSVEVPDDASAQDKLLGYSGRQPG